MKAPIDRVTEDDVRAWEARWSRVVEGRDSLNYLFMNRTPADVAATWANDGSGAVIVHGPDMLGRVLMHEDGKRVFIRVCYWRGQLGAFAVYLGDVP